LSKATN